MDPGTTVTGYGMVAGGGRGFELLECGVVRPDPDAELAGKLVDIHRGLADVLERWEPDVVSVEGIFYGRNARTAGVLGHARGVVVMTAALRELEVAEYSPSRIKNAVVGAGNASKEQVGYMVRKHLSLKETPSPSDASDGCAAALCHLLVGTGPLAGRGSG